MYKVAVLVGSLNANSNNQKLAKALEKLAHDRMSFEFLPLGDLPHYDDSLWSNAPQSVLDLKKTVADADAVLFVTPEYNRSYSAVIKNAIEWASRPYGQSAWAGKPAAVVGTSPGALGAAIAQSQLRAILLHLDMYVLGQPEVFFQSKPGLIAEDFSITDEQTAGFLENFVGKFHAWIGRFADADAERVAAE